MNSQHKRLFILAAPLFIFVGLVFFLWFGLYRDPRAIPSPLLNKPIPQQLGAHNFLGHVTILNVFASWCVACQQEHSIWKEARQGLSKQTQIVGLNYKDQHAKAIAWLNQYVNPYDQVIEDPTGAIAIDLGVYGVPETFIIDKQGIIRYKVLGAVNTADWQKTILPIIHQWEGNAN